VIITHEAIDHAYQTLIEKYGKYTQARAKLGEAERMIKHALANATARGLIHGPKHGKNVAERDAHARVYLANHYATLEHATRSLAMAEHAYEIARLEIQHIKLRLQLSGLELENERLRFEANQTGSRVTTWLPSDLEMHPELLDD
jgi:hypothetical protein